MAYEQSQNLTERLSFKQDKYYWIENEIPWLVPEAVDFIEKNMKPTDKVLEFGVGGSTLWFRKRAAEVLSIDHSQEWADKVSGVKLLKPEEYKKFLEELPKEHFDWLLIDGVEGWTILDLGRAVLKRGGYLIFDNYSGSDRTRRMSYIGGWWKEEYNRKGWYGGTCIYRKP